VHVLDQLDARLLEVPVKVLDVGLVEIDLRDRGGDIAEGQHAKLLPSSYEAFDLLKLLKLSYQHPVSTCFLALEILILPTEIPSRDEKSRKNGPANRSAKPTSLR